ncbi:MAG: metallophosphoesterase [Candidatus Hydrogenedens sp.]|jgi:predicted MPP superfamily phosphohydrolase|nr:metallophosphoesterase [Candidatus Hydrogenedens sp.]
MSAIIAPTEYPLPELKASLDDNPWMATLRERPPLSQRQAELKEKRVQVEQFHRSTVPGLTELDPVTFSRGMLMCGLRLFLKCLGIYERGRRNALDLQLNEVEVFWPHLPTGLEGLRILHLSDLHLSRRFPAFAEKAGRLLQGLAVDVCVMTGDYRWGYYGPIDHVPPQIHTLLDGVRSRFGTVAVLGNHDTFEMAETLEEAGIPVLFNEGIALPFRDATLWLCGIDDPHVYGCDSIETALEDSPENSWKVLLAHTPESIPEAAEAGISFYLCGHTHGGQIRLPLIGAPSSNARCSRDQVLGRWQYGDMMGHTSPGLGTTDLPVRYGCPPEATVLTLRRGREKIVSP